MLAAPEALVGREFAEMSEMFMKYRTDRRSCLLIGIQRGEEMLINPIGEEAGPLQSADQLILLSRVFPALTYRCQPNHQLRQPLAGKTQLTKTVICMMRRMSAALFLQSWSS